MFQALTVVAARKPLVVVMGPVAGSGGYYVAAPGAWIIARPGTLTGSIGVLTGKLVTGGMWSKLLFNRETISYGEHVTLESDQAPFTDEQRAIVNRGIKRTYHLFLQRVADARKMTVDEVHPIAAGRVWTGLQALDRKLVDEMGGMETGLRKARSLAGLPEKAPVRETRAPKRPLAPLAPASIEGWLGYTLEGLSILNRTPTLALMEYGAELE
jgi:protease-4